MKQYLDIVRKVLTEGREKRPVRKNEEGVFVPVDGGVTTIACANVPFSHDMSNGFPLLTTKKMAWRSIRVELEGFIKGIVNKQWYKDRKCNIWNQWANPELVDKRILEDFGHLNVDWEIRKKYQEELNDLGKIYGFQFRAFGDYSYELQVVLPKKPSKESEEYQPKYKIVKQSKIESCSPCGNDSNGRPLVKVVLSSGFEKTVRKDQKTVLDPYKITVCETGYLGDLRGIDKASKIYKNLYKCWSHVLNRCYNKSCKEYKYYGERGVYVSKRWHNFTNFYNDVRNISGFSYKLREPNKYQLDKDHFQSNCYSKDTCVWLPKEMNIAYTGCTPFEAISPSGDVYKHISPQKFAEIHGLNGSCIRRCLKGDREHHKKWKFKKTKNLNLRFKIPYDQLASITETLRNNPMDRRMVCSAWNPRQLPQMALPPCHWGWNITVIEDELNLFWVQRSCDLMLGVPFNIASYGLLLELLAKDAGLKAGNLSGMFVDCHIYGNQVEMAKEQVKRVPTKLPIIELPSDLDIFKWEWKDAKLNNYNPQEQIKFGDVVV